MSRLTGNKDTDFLILQQLTDRDLGAVCSVNRYAKALCEDDVFWRRRFYLNPIVVELTKELKANEYPEDFLPEKISEIKQYLEFPDWRSFYKFLIIDIEFPWDTREMLVGYIYISKR